MTDSTTAPAPGGTPAPATGAVSLREFARLVPMPYSTAREWARTTPHRPALIAVTTTATGRMLAELDQLPAVRAARTGTPAPEVAP